MMWGSVQIPPCVGKEVSAHCGMAVQSGTSAAIYTGNNSTVAVYPVPFPYLLASDIYVAVQQGEGEVSILAQGVDYTLTPTVDSSDNITGGEVLTTVEYDNTWTLTIFRQVSLTQLTELPEAGPISSRSLEKAYDKATMALQQIHRRVLALEGIDDGGSVVVIPEGSTGETLQDVQTFADATARGNALPKRVGQLGVQLDNGTLWRSNGSGSGAWARAVTLAQVQASTPARVFGRKTAGSGDGQELSLSEVLDFIGSAAQGDILYRGAGSWARLGAGTAGQVLRTGGAGGIPAWTDGKVVNVWRASSNSTFSTTTTIPADNTIPQSTEGVEVINLSITPGSTSNFLIVMFSAFVANSGIDGIGAALFRDSGANAIFAKGITIPTANHQGTMDFHCSLPVPSTSSQTYKVRIGPFGASTAHINRGSGGLVYGGVGQITMTIFEVLL